MTTTRLGDALGAEVSGVDWARGLEAEQLQAVRAAFLEHQLLCLRSNPLEPVAFADVARIFGEPQLQLLRDQRSEGAPEVSVLESTYKTPDDKPDDLGMVRLSGWHTDDSYFQRPAKATVLQALAIPSTGGETRFANTRTAYDDLSDDMKGRLAQMTAVHKYATERAAVPARTLTAEEEAETHEAFHPLIRSHEDTGQKALYFNSNRTDRIDGLDPDDSAALLDRIHAHMSQPKYQYHHRWRLGDILIWDNRNLVHSVNMDFPVGERRVHQRILLKGEIPN